MHSLSLLLLLTLFFSICFISFAQISGIFLMFDKANTVDKVANETTAHANQVYQHFIYAQRSKKKCRIEYSKNRTEVMLSLWFYWHSARFCLLCGNPKHILQRNPMFSFQDFFLFGVSFCIRMCKLLSWIVESIKLHRR